MLGEDEKYWGRMKFIKTLPINRVFQAKLVISQEPHNPLGSDAIVDINLEHHLPRGEAGFELILISPLAILTQFCQRWRRRGTPGENGEGGERICKS